MVIPNQLQTSNNKDVNTDDQLQVMPYVAIMLIALAATVIVLRKIRKEKDVNK